MMKGEPRMARAVGVGWIGWRSDDVDKMVGFLRDVMGIRLERVAEGGYWAGSLDDGTIVEVFDAAGGRNRHMGVGAAVGFVVSDAEGATEALRRAGVEIVLEAQYGESGQCWAHFRGPDGGVYQVMDSAQVDG